MITDELAYRIQQAMGLDPTPEQQQAIVAFSSFMTSHQRQPVMLLTGSAGTGKTTLAAAIVKGLKSLGQKLVLLAPTGRAAKVFAQYSGVQAYTIHRRIYRQRQAGDPMSGSFQLNYNVAQDTLFLVDEASMVSNGAGASGGFPAEKQRPMDFGSGRLLDDLIEYVYGGKGCRLMLIGDRAQLPPVGEEESPALMAEVLRSYWLTVYEAHLTQVLRQAEDSGILWNATRVRYSLLNAELPKVRFRGFPDIHIVRGDELIDQLGTSYAHAGTDETIVITRSNKRANIYNDGIRRTVLDRDGELCSGDMLMIVKNNYSFKEERGERREEENSTRYEVRGAKYEDSLEAEEVAQSNLVPRTSHLEPRNATAKSQKPTLDFLANGDRCVVRRVRNEQQLYGFRFADVTFTLPDYDDLELTLTMLLDTLHSEAPALTRQQQMQLFEGVMADYQDIRYKSERMKKLKEDRFYNALQVKYAYAVTCHKAQGGQWEHVYVDQGYMTDDMLTPDYIHWLYTAFTRATDCLFLVNWPEKQVDNVQCSAVSPPSNNDQL